MGIHFSSDYVEKVYAGWLGKIIGVRYGAPIEMWSSQKIADTYGELDGYVKYYHDFAADDDTNGPLFFTRALEDYASEGELKPEHIANAIMNYVSCGEGFFWWGGYGVSAEHTLYENLKCGIRPPHSGSEQQNGIVIAEQIGGQIFIDGWGLICPGNYRKAAEYAKKAACVGWDRNGIYGGMFVAACISAAFEDHDIMSVLSKGISVIPQESDYAHMARDIIDFHEHVPEDWRACLSYVQQNYWSDKFHGGCHIIPNAAIIVLALLYGNGDFTKTLNIGNMCGFDTDCNVGNLGTILGVMNGLEGIDYEKWRKPINDFQVCSSVVGCLNITDAASSALYFARLAFAEANQPFPEKYRLLTERPHYYHFELPESTQSIRGELISNRSENVTVDIKNTQETAARGERCLQAFAEHFEAYDKLKVFVKTFYMKEDFEDDRYRPSFSPILYPGQTISVNVKACPGVSELEAAIFVKDYHTGELHVSEMKNISPSDWSFLEYTLPAGTDWCIKEAGVLAQMSHENTLVPGNHRAIGVYIDELTWKGMPHYFVNFSKEKNWQWEEKILKTQLTQFTKNKGIWHLENGTLRGHCSDWAETYTGDVVWKDYIFTVKIKPISGKWHGVNFRVQGACRSYVLCCGANDSLLVMKKIMTIIKS